MRHQNDPFITGKPEFFCFSYFANLLNITEIVEDPCKKMALFSFVFIVLYIFVPYFSVSSHSK